jgi:hypothetical protein
MKKIMFNDKYGLTRAVLQGRKTQTRRIAFKSFQLGMMTSKDVTIETLRDGSFRYMLSNGLINRATYSVGEPVAIAQKYSDLMGNDLFRCLCNYKGVSLESVSDQKGFTSKMYVRADLMIHHIRIKNIRVERLQEISDEDCIAEGIRMLTDVKFYEYGYDYKKKDSLGLCLTHTPREAYASLIDKICGAGTWEKDPFVFVYDFELIIP